ncbi:MAG: outer membrane beta-barrel protein [Bacteroidaceae bacterium]
MKKVFLSLVAFATTLVASAQVYVSGEVGFWNNDDDDKTSVSIRPEVGYILSEDWAIGTTLGWDYLKIKENKVNAFIVAPYARYTCLKLGSVSLFLDGGFTFSTSKMKGAEESGNAWEIGVKPGISIKLAEKFNFVSHIGFIGYCDKDDNFAGSASKGFGLNLDATNVTFGILYNF